MALRFGLIGCGSQGGYLCEALRVAGGGELVACADVREEAAARAAEQFGFGETYADYREMLAQAELDAVVVATTHDHLQPAALTAVRAGRHVFVEKPMALTVAEGRELVDAARAADVRLMVGYALRYKADRRKLKQLVTDGAVGEVRHVTVGQLIGGVGGWLADPQRGGGPLYYIGSHVIDQVLWLIDDPIERVYAEIDQPAGEVERDALMTIKFAGGQVAQVTCAQRFGGRYGWLDVLGTKGRIRSEWESHRLTVESQVIPEYRHLTHLDVPVDAYLPKLDVTAPATLVTHFYIRMWAAEMAEFVAAVEAGADPPVTGEDGVRVLSVIEAAFASARSGGPVAVGG